MSGQCASWYKSSWPNRKPKAKTRRPLILHRAIVSIRRPYYGWWIVAGGIICQFASMSVSQVVVGVFMRPVIEELGWQVWQFTLGSSLAVGAGAFSGIIAGNVVDRRGPRPLILLGAIVSAICFYALGRQSNLLAFLFFYVLSGLVGWNLFGPLVVNATLNKWFIKNRGWALAIGSVGISFAGLITPVTMTAVVDSMGWRDGYTALAMFTLLVVVPVAFIMRRTPEDFGLYPDGDVVRSDEIEFGQATRAETRSLTRSEAVHTSGFWLLTLGFFLNMAALSSVLIHAIPFATDAGFSRRIAALALAVNGFGNLSSKAIWGYSLQRVQPRILVVAAFSLSSVGVGLMLTASAVGETPMLLVGFFLYGFGFGGTIPLSEFLWAKYFGRAHIGAIRGISFPITVLGMAGGPVLIGLWFDLAQTYQPAFLTVIGAYLTGAVLVWISREP